MGISRVYQLLQPLSLMLQEPMDIQQNLLSQIGKASGILLCSMSLLLHVTKPVAAQTRSNGNCQASIAAAQARLDAVGNLEVTVRSGDIFYSDYPEGRPQEYFFVMTGSAVESVMRSKVMLTDISNTIIQACDTVGLVNFGLAHSGWHIPFGVFPDGQVKAFDCAEDYGMEPGRGSSGYRLTWGLFYCSL